MRVTNALTVAGTATLIPNSGSFNGTLRGNGTLNVLPGSTFWLNGDMSSLPAQ